MKSTSFSEHTRLCVVECLAVIPLLMQPLVVSGHVSGVKIYLHEVLVDPTNGFSGSVFLSWVVKLSNA